MKMQKYAIFIKKSLKIKIFRIKNIAKLKIIVHITVNIKVLYGVYVT